MRRVLKKQVVIFVCVLVIAGAALCATLTAAPQSTTTSIWINNMPIVGVQNNPIANELAKRTGVTMNVVSGDAQKFKLLLAGGDLPDIVQFNFTSLQMDANTLISSGQLVELDS
jgi:ABC-type glycerol-3-phosphate transport system substrate-binding protein